MYMGYTDIKEWLESKDYQKQLDELSKKFKNKKIIGYGTGLLAKVLLDNYDLSALNIIGFTDSKSTEQEFYNFKLYKPDDIKALNPDIILIFTINDAQIKKFLKVNYPEIAKIPGYPVIVKNLNDKIEFFLDAWNL